VRIEGPSKRDPLKSGVRVKSFLGGTKKLGCTKY
jgi:hypothetical protein